MESIAPKHVQSLTNLISEDINEYFGKAMYLDHNVIILKSNGYINMTKLQIGKEGTYVHPKLAPHIASWINPKVAIIVADIYDKFKTQSLFLYFQNTTLVEKIQQKDQQLALKSLELQEKCQVIQQIRNLDSQTFEKIQFNNKDYKIYGDKSEPLFLANDIIVQLLQHEKLNGCRFYKDNKHNSLYFNRWQFDTTPLELQKRMKNVPNQKIIFLTELGLYRCLFQSNKPFAIEFQEQIFLLLKDIRLGNIKLQIIKECEFSSQIQQKQNDLLQYSLRTQNLEQQISSLQDQIDSMQEELQQKNQIVEKCKKTCSLYKQKVLYPDQIQKEYAGSSNNPFQRNKQHRSHSSNPELRQAFQKGYNVEFELIETFDYYTEDERRRKERLLILEIPIEKRLNKVIPRI